MMVPEGEFKEEKLTPAQLEELQRDRNTMEDLDKIKLPLEVSIYSNNRRWTYRNDAYRDMVNKMDIKAKEELEKLINQNS